MRIVESSLWIFLQLRNIMSRVHDTQEKLSILIIHMKYQHTMFMSGLNEDAPTSDANNMLTLYEFKENVYSREHLR